MNPYFYQPNNSYPQMNYGFNMALQPPGPPQYYDQYSPPSAPFGMAGPPPSSPQENPTSFGMAGPPLSNPQENPTSFGMAGPPPSSPQETPAPSAPLPQPTPDAGVPVQCEEARRAKEEALRSEGLYEDLSFPAENSSLFPSKQFHKNVNWKRPQEIVRDPKFISDGFSRFDVRQGELGDCWLLAAVSNLTLHPSLFNNIVLPGQNFQQNYFGFFHFRFWRFGEWRNVIVDDKLPTVDGKLAFMHSADGEEFWSALLEKAYAKLHGSYEALSGGRPSMAMDDFTGGVSEFFDLKRSTDPNLFEIVLKGFERGSLMACSMEPNPDVVEQRMSNGLIKGHAYSITCVNYCTINSPRMRESIPLIRLRNPWGNEAEWNGSWSDQSQEWNYVSPEERHSLGLTFDHDGEFWMSFADFKANFDCLEMTNVNLEALTEKDINNHVKHKWEVKKFKGTWVRGLTAGGCSNHQTTFWNNPKYYVTLKEEDDGDKDMQCTMIVALLQKPKKAVGGKDVFLSIGFSIHPVPASILSSGDALNESVLRSTREIKGLPSYLNRRQISYRFHLEPGTYCVIPSTYNPDEEGSFMMRVFCEKPNLAKEIDNPIGFVGLKKKIGGKNEPLTPTPSEAAQTEAIMKKVFENIAGPDGQIDWKELQKVLNRRFEADFAFEGFGKSACRSMVAMMDTDKSGTLGFDEFVHLWNIVTIWKKAFQEHDKDSSGKLSGCEFRDALLTSGFQIPNGLFLSLVTIYGDEQKQIFFDDFVLCAIRMSKAFKAFSEKDIMKTQTAIFTLEEFVEQSLCN